MIFGAIPWVCCTVILCVVAKVADSLGVNTTHRAMSLYWHLSQFVFHVELCLMIPFFIHPIPINVYNFLVQEKNGVCNYYALLRFTHLPIPKLITDYQ